MTYVAAGIALLALGIFLGSARAPSRPVMPDATERYRKFRAIQIKVSSRRVDRDPGDGVQTRTRSK